MTANMSALSHCVWAMGGARKGPTVMIIARERGMGAYPQQVNLLANGVHK